MATTSHYEVYVLEGNRWAFMARYSGKEREDAMTDARQIEVRTGRPTKVVRDTYYNELNYSEETVAYMSPNAKEHDKRPASRAQASRRPVQRSQGSASRPAPRTQKVVPQTKPLKLQPVSNSSFFVKLILALVASIVIAAGLTAALGFFINALSNLGVEIPDTVNAQIGLFWYGAMFLLTSVALNKAYVPWRQFILGVRQNATEHPAPTESKNKRSKRVKMAIKPRQPSAMERAAKEQEIHDVRVLRGDPEVTPDPYAQDESNGGEIEPDAFAFDQHNRTENLAEPPSSPDTPAPPAQKETESEDTSDNASETLATEDADEDALDENNESISEESALTTPITEMDTERVFMIKLLGDLVTSLRSSQDQMDPSIRQGVNLYLAGAASVLSDRRGLTPDEEHLILDEALRLIGNEDADREVFFADFERRLSDTRNHDLIHAGEVAMIRSLTETNNSSKGLDTALRTWIAPAASPLPAIEHVFLLTYADVSVAATTTGDDLMDRHNRLARVSIAEHDGSEVRHTGKGIFARFGNADDAICAAIAMQQERSRQSKSSSPPPVMRVALTASLSGEGDPELSGNVFSYADALCRRLADGQIAGDELVQKTCTIPAVACDRTIPTVHSGITDRGRAIEIKWEPVPA